MPAAAIASSLVIAACATHPANRPLPAAGAPKIGRPYEVLGRTYYPSDDRTYDVVGIASWYGPGFHGLYTANGEAYDMDGLSAAHKTLPLPSYVEVTNLVNGRVLTIRINDRGPFVDGRIIDLSRRSAQLLGIDQAGTARVRVRRVYPDNATLAALVPAKVAAPVPVAVVPAVPAVPVASVPVETLFVQVAALNDQGRAAWLAGYLRPMAPTLTERTAAGLWRVRLGPFATPESARAILAQVQAAGYREARVVSAAPPG